MVTVRASGSSTRGSSPLPQLPGESVVRQFLIEVVKKGIKKLEEEETEAKNSGVQGPAMTTPTMQMQPEALGSAKAPSSPTTSSSPAASACFPEGITSIEMWAETELDYGKYKDDGFSFHDIDVAADTKKINEFKIYRKWILEHIRPDLHHKTLVNYKAYLLHCKKHGGPTFPGTTLTQTLSPPKSEA
jgi:hypothetical protein